MGSESSSGEYPLVSENQVVDNGLPNNVVDGVSRFSAWDRAEANGQRRNIDKVVNLKQSRREAGFEGYKAVVVADVVSEMMERFSVDDALRAGQKFLSDNFSELAGRFQRRFLLCVTFPGMDRPVLINADTYEQGMEVLKLVCNLEGIEKYCVALDLMKPFKGK